MGKARAGGDGSDCGDSRDNVDGDGLDAKIIPSLVKVWTPKSRSKNQSLCQGNKFNKNTCLRISCCF